MKSFLRVVAALLMAVLCHGLFALAVGSMAICLAGGLQEGFGRLPSGWAWVANLALLLQFPILHSTLLSRKGRGWLQRKPQSRALEITPGGQVALRDWLGLALWQQVMAH